MKNLAGNYVVQPFLTPHDH